MFRLEFEVDGRPRSKGSHVAQVVRNRAGKPVRVRAAAVQEEDLDHWTGAIRTAASLALTQVNGWEAGVERRDILPGMGYPRAWAGPVLVLARFRLTRPQRLADTLDDEPATVVPDGDKLERALWDALTGLAFADDRQVIGWSGLKRYASPLERPGVSALVLALDDDEAMIPGHVPALIVQEMERWEP